MLVRGVLVFLLIWCNYLVNPVSAREKNIMEPRVPQDKLKEARSLTSPLPQLGDTMEKGRAIYEGKGTCFNCHGKTGRGDGPGGLSLNPSPRNFSHHGMWRHRSEGEIFWVIKHGSPGTGMIPFGGLLTDEEIWTVMQYEHSFSKDHGFGRRKHHGRVGPRGGGHRGPHGRGGHQRMHGESEQDECCKE